MGVGGFMKGWHSYLPLHSKKNDSEQLRNMG